MEKHTDFLAFAVVQGQFRCGLHDANGIPTLQACHHLMDNDARVITSHVSKFHKRTSAYLSSQHSGPWHCGLPKIDGHGQQVVCTSQLQNWHSYVTHARRDGSHLFRGDSEFLKIPYNNLNPAQKNYYLVRAQLEQRRKTNGNQYTAADTTLKATLLREKFEDV